QTEQVPQDNRQGVGYCARLFHTGRWVREGDKGDSQQRRGVVVPVGFVGNVVQIVAGADGPGAPPEDIQVAHAPFQKSGAQFHNAAKANKREEQKDQGCALPFRQALTLVWLNRKGWIQAASLCERDLLWISGE